MLLHVFSLLFLASAQLILCRTFHNSKDAPPLHMPKTYIVEGEIRIPYAEIIEPFTAYVDVGNNRSRIDYYGGVTKTFQRPDIKPFGVNQKIVFMSTDRILNKESCFQVNGTKNATITNIQDVFPNVLNDSYKYQGIKKIGNNSYDVWKLEKFDPNGPDKLNTYTLWMTQGSNVSSPVPVRFEMLGYDELFGSHYDRYDIIYKSVQVVANLSKSYFNIPDNLTCTGFPGPGNMHMNPMREFINNDDNHIHEVFENFKERHNKFYPDHKEHNTRKNNFKHNLRFIQSTNRQGKSFMLDINHLTDWSNNELRMLRGKLRSTGEYNGALPFDTSDFDTNDIPDSLDWRLYGAVNPVKDQAICGSCWSFGTTGTIEGANFVKTGKLIRLSEQALMDCSWGYGNNGCDGGEDYRAYQWIMKNGGIPTTDAYGPYLGQDGKCSDPRNISVIDKIQIENYVNVTTNDENELKLALFHHGPISISIDASQKTFAFYSNGVYYEPKCKNDVDSLDHSVLAVGFGVLNGENYWLVKNSWSTYWGNDGYVLMNQKNNNCGVTTQPTFVLIK